LGRLANEKPLAGQHPELEYSNFAEVDSGCPNLISTAENHALNTRAKEVRFTFKFGIQAKRCVNGLSRLI
jgi:hypothetical protein